MMGTPVPDNDLPDSGNAVPADDLPFTDPEQSQMNPKSEPFENAVAKAKSGAINLGAGAVRGAGSIGATLLYPWDKALDLYTGQDGHNTDRRNKIDEGLTTLTGSDPNSLAYKTGKIGTEVAGTMGAGGLLAKGAEFLGATPEFSAALKSGGLSLGGETSGNAVGNGVLRAVAGGAVGATSAGMVDPNTAGTGGVIGAITPGAALLTGALGKGVSNVAGKVLTNSLGMTTGTGADAVSAAFNAGAKGDTSFLKNMRGDATMEDIVSQAKDALNQMKMQRSADYRAGMADVSNDKTVLDMQPIKDAVTNLQSMGSYKGQVINKNAAGTVQDLADQVNNWASLDPTQYHTPEGLDALKKSIQDIRDAAPYGTPGRVAADNVYNAVKGTITKQAPKYAEIMQGYSDASDQLDEITKSLSLGNKASADTALRKLQSVMRNNVSTNYGNRVNSVNALDQQGGSNLVPAIAGQSMNTWVPRGLAGIGDTIGLAAGAHFNPMTLGAAAAASPRLVGEGAYLAGRASAPLSSIVGSGLNNVSKVAPILGAQPNPQLSSPTYLRDLINQSYLTRNNNP